MTKTVTSKSFALNDWNDGTRRSYPQTVLTPKRWYPGHWMRYNGYGASSLSARVTAYTRVAGNPAVRGAVLFVLWGIVEVSPGVYDWSGVDAEIAELDAIGKKAILDLYPIGYSDTVPSTPQTGERKFAPDYIVNAGWVGNLSFNAGASFPGPGWGARLDIAACNDRYIAFFESCRARYDGDPRVVAVMTGETSLNIGLGSSGTNYADYLTQWQRLANVLPAMFENMFVYILNNGMNSTGNTQLLMDAQFANKAGQSRPDVLGYSLTDESWADYAARGAGVVSGVGTFGTTDYRGRIPIAAEQQVIRGIDKTPADSLFVANAYRKASMLVWTIFDGYDPGEYGSGVPVPAFRWDGASGVVNFLANPANALTNTTYPTLI